METVLSQSLAVWEALPVGVRVTLVLAGGWLAAVLGRLVTSAILTLLRVERAAHRVGVTEFLRKGGVNYTVPQLGGVLVYWVAFVAALLGASRMLDLQIVNAIFDRVVELVPGILAGAVIIAVGLLIVSFVSNFLRTILRNAAFPHADLAARVTRTVGVVLILLLGLEQGNFGQTIINTLILVLVSAVALASALAVGLGCQDLARDWVQSTLTVLRERRRQATKSDLEG